MRPGWKMSSHGSLPRNARLRTGGKDKSNSSSKYLLLGAEADILHDPEESPFLNRPGQPLPQHQASMTNRLGYTPRTSGAANP